MRNRTLLPVLTLLALIGGLMTLPSFADSQARIVRLSQVDGDVQIDRNTGKGFERAFLNLPVTQGMKIETGLDGKAEVEFEDGSAVRITPNTVIAFPELVLRDSGGKASTVNLQEGTAYVNFLGNKNKSDQLTLTFGKEKVSLSEAAHLRVYLGDADASVAVFKGTVQVSGPAGEVELSKSKTATFDLAQGYKYELAKNLEPDPYDAWDKQQSEYHDRYAVNNSTASSSPYAYGGSDLNYYGTFMNVPGYGTMWQPYFAGAGWDPFMNGVWSYYPGYGYAWVSGYPWGWTPYHYGSWIYVPAYGWGWQPGGSWAGLNQPNVNGGSGFVPPKPPAGGNNTVVVNRGGSFPTTSNGFFGSKMTIGANSAGLGVPRGSVHNLGSLSSHAQQHGTVTTRLPSSSVWAPGNTGWGSPAWSRPGYASPGVRSPGVAPHSAPVHSAPVHSSGGGHSSPHR